MVHLMLHYILLKKSNNSYNKTWNCAIKVYSKMYNVCECFLICLKLKRIYRFSPQSLFLLCTQFVTPHDHTRLYKHASRYIAPKGLATFFTPNTDQKYSLKIEVVSPCLFTTELLFRPDQLSSSRPILWTITQPKWRKAAMKPKAISQSL